VGYLIEFTRTEHSAPVQQLSDTMSRGFRTKLRQQQLDQTAKISPVAILFHLCACIASHIIFAPYISLAQLRIWQLSFLVSAALAVLTLYGWRRTIKTPEQVLRYIYYTTASALAVAICWSVPPLFFIAQISTDSGFVVYGVTLAVLAVGVITLLRIPFAAIIYISTLVGMLSFSIFQHVSSNRILITSLCMLFGLALNFIVYILHRSFLQSAEADWKTEKQNSAIALLLNDFEHQTNDWLFETHSNGEIYSFSPSLAELLDCEPALVMGSQFLNLFEDNMQLTAFFKAELDFANAIVPYTTKGNSQFWNISAKPKFDSSHLFIGYSGVGRNVTLQHKAELEIREAKNEAEKASAAKSQFLAIMSHELRTPINAIVGFSEVLSVDGPLISTENRKAYLETILESSKQLQGLINDILDATRVERGALKINDQDIDAAELVESSIKICRDHLTKADISVVAHLLDDVSLIGDLTRLKQVLVNLFTNAIKFSPLNSVINVDMRVDLNGDLVISVRDAGIGIDPQDAERVFEPFVQLDDGSTRRFGGVGLGLSIARRIARLHGGDISLQGNVGMGTHAILTLPAARVVWPNAKMDHGETIAA
jgi:signal transduction histidine kinase